MKITYDPEVDALYIELRRGKPVDSSDVGEGVTVDLDDDGQVLGIEVLDASKRMTADELASVHYENLLLVRRAAAKSRVGAAKR